MPWGNISLNDGTSIPSIAFGTWKIGNGQGPIDQVEQALSVGFNHIDTAQAYGNEEEAGKALKESGLSRSDVYITTKFSGRADIPTSIQNSLNNLGVTHVDLYLVHHPRLAVPDIPTAWAQMEKLKSDGLTKSIGVSNFGVEDLKTLLASAKVKPVVNQILFHPYVYAQQAPIIEFGRENGVEVEGYSLLIPLTQSPGGPLDKPLKQLQEKYSATADQILMAWANSKGVVVVTTSSKKERLEGYLAAGDIKLTDAEIDEIDVAGALGARRIAAKTYLQRAIGIALAGAAILATCSYLGIDVF